MGNSAPAPPPPPSPPPPPIFTGPANVIGSWDGPYPTSLVAAAAAHLPDSRLLYWSAFAKTTFGGTNGKTWVGIFDPDTNSITEELVVDTNHDTYLPDSRIMVTGGSASEATTIYDPITDSWERGDNLNIKRGYHSMTLLGDGSVFTLGGSWSGGVGNKHGELWTEESGWRTLPGVRSEGSILTRDVKGVAQADNHMWLFAAPNGKVFHAGPSRDTHWIDTTGSGSVVRSLRRGQNDMMCGNAVMFDVGKLLVIGGSPYQDSGNAWQDAFVFDLNNGDNVSVEKVGNMVNPRVFASALVLPTGQVLVLGGQRVTRKFSDANSVLQAEVWDPETETFSPLASMQVPRTYHSVCLLMKDARVWCAGGGLCGNCNANHADAEIFSPPYLFDKDSGALALRPSILSFQTSVTTGGLLKVKLSQECTAFSMIRLAAVTHTVDNDTRRVPLTIEGIIGDEYFLRLPSNPSVVLAGPYYLFAMNAEGVPSIGATVTVKAGVGETETIPPTVAPTSVATPVPTPSPTTDPTETPTSTPTVKPTTQPSSKPVAEPTVEPTAVATPIPTTLVPPSRNPTSSPTSQPALVSTTVPTATTSPPTLTPTGTTTASPTAKTTASPTVTPTVLPTPTPTTLAPVPVPTTNAASFFLIFTPTNSVVSPLFNGAVINLAQMSISDDKFNVEAVPLVPNVSKVKFLENGRTESVEPYAYCGDEDGFYFACNEFQDNNNSGQDTTVSAVLLGSQGDTLGTASVTFRIVNE